MLAQLSEDLVQSSGPNLGDGSNEYQRNQLMVLHAHLHRSQATELGPVQIPKKGHIELAHLLERIWDWVDANVKRLLCIFFFLIRCCWYT